MKCCLYADRSGLYPVWFVSIICSVVEQAYDLWCSAWWVSVCLTLFFCSSEGRFLWRIWRTCSPVWVETSPARISLPPGISSRTILQPGWFFLPSVHLLICQNRFVCNVVLMFVALVVLSICVWQWEILRNKLVRRTRAVWPTWKEVSALSLRLRMLLHVRMLGF